MPISASASSRTTPPAIWKRSWAKLLKKNGPQKGAILDLRSNPGGLLTAAVAVSDDFLDSGTIVTTRGRLPDSNLTFAAHPGDLLNGAPMVLLTDNGTASAAEIVSGALKDNHRALIVGRRTFGKGVVQTVLPLDAEHAVKITTARYYTPNGTSIQAEGIKPDIALGDLTVAKVDNSAEPDQLRSRPAASPGQRSGQGRRHQQRRQCRERKTGDQRLRAIAGAEHPQGPGIAPRCRRACSDRALSKPMMQKSPSPHGRRAFYCGAFQPIVPA